MRTLCAVLTLTFCIVASAAQAIVLHDQPLDSWGSGWCSPCSGDLNSGYDFRTFGSFSLASNSTLQRGTFAVHDVGSASDDLHISIWDAPLSTQLYTLNAPGGSYSIVPNPSADQYYAIVDLPNWPLTSGSYWVGLFGDNGNHLGWGSNFLDGDDAQYNGVGGLVSDTRYVGFTLEGTVPEPGSLTLASLALVAAGCVRRR